MVDWRIRIPDLITKRLSSSLIWRGVRDKVCYLTFDDGPVPEVTPWLLDLLKDKGIKGTFFVVGNNVDKYPELHRRIVAEGHTIGNHTYNHTQGVKVSTDRFISDVERASKVVDSRLFRPPHGLMRVGQYSYLNINYKIVMWDIVSCDYNSKLSGDTIVNNVMDNIRPGSIITFHDSIKAEKNIRYALPIVIERLREEGYRFSTVDKI